MHNEMISEGSATVFSNKHIQTSELPRLQELALTPISRRYRIINLSAISAIALVLLSIVTALRFQSLFELPEDLVFAYPYICSVIFGLAFLWATYHFFADTKITYAVREQDVSKQSGLIFRKLSCQPILRVQHVELNRGPLERWAGLASLQVFSAGGEMYTFEIPGLELEKAQKIRQFILDHKDVSAR